MLPYVPVSRHYGLIDIKVEAVCQEDLHHIGGPASVEPLVQDLLGYPLRCSEPHMYPAVPHMATLVVWRDEVVDTPHHSAPFYALHVLGFELLGTCCRPAFPSLL